MPTPTYPKTLPSKRIQLYRRKLGDWSRWRSLFARTVHPEEVAAACVGVGIQNVAPHYFVGTAVHESGLALNEGDTETNGFQSWGIYQVSLGEAADVGLPDANLLELEDATRVMILLAERNRRAVREAAKLQPTEIDPPDINPYIFIAHNQGREAARKTIAAHGINWAAYVERNGAIVKPGFNGPAIVRYGNDVL